MAFDLQAQRFTFAQRPTVLSVWRAQREQQRHREIARRQRSDMRSGFAGAAVGRLTASLQTWSGALNADLDGGLVPLRARARALAVNYEFARRFLTLCKINIVGPNGPTLQVRAKGPDGAMDTIGNDIIENAFYNWCRRCDITGRLSFAHACRMVVAHVARDGEMLVRLIRDRTLPNGLALQLLEPDRLDETYNATLSNGNFIRMGVELNSVLRPIAFHVKSRHPGENEVPGRPGVERVMANDLLHIYVPERAEQVRGYSWFHAVIGRAANTQGYEEAAIVAARVGAAKMGIFTRTDDTVGGADLGPVGDGIDPATGNVQMSVEPGEFMTAPDGYKLDNWDPEYPHQNFADFVNQCMYGLAAGLDVAAHNLSGNMTGVNYSSARIAELSERDVWRTLQAWFFDQFAYPVYAAWLESALLRNEIALDNGKVIGGDKLGKFLAASEFLGRTWAWVDPLKEIKAAREEIDAGLNSRTQIAAANGRDFATIVAELKTERESLQAAGVDTSPAPAGATDPLVTQ